MSRGQSFAPVLWPAVDVGGTSIRLLLVAGSELPQPSPAIRIEVSSEPGLAALTASIGSCLREAKEMAARRGYRVADALAIGTPGRLEPGVAGGRVIAPRSATNLEAAPGEMDGVDLAAELAEGLGIPRNRVFWENDAVAQGRHMIGELLGDPESAGLLEGHTVVCINPGTGLGGCVAHVEDGLIEVFTDGHVSELLIHPVELAADVGPITVAARSSDDGATIHLAALSATAKVSESVRSPNVKQAENFISGSGLTRMATALEACCARVSPPVTCFGPVDHGLDGRSLSDLIEADTGSTATRAARFIGELGGLAMARLMTVLHEGSAVKSAPFPTWSSADLRRIRGVTRFILGGGITDTPLGRLMISQARSQLAHWPELEIFDREQVADAGALGAFSLIPAEILRAEEERR
jgi:hypothetical protein